MKTWETILLFGLGLGLALAIASVTPVPGYMDAEYYYAGGGELAAGRGFTEPFLWNYLDDPQGLPHPSATYWMPLAALVSALGMVISGRHDFFSARLLFLLLAALVPVLTAWLALKYTGRKVTAWTAGGLALFSGFYTIYLGLTETFTLYMLLGSLFMAVLVSGMRWMWKAMLLGLLAGLLHLARADGVLWLIIGAFTLIYNARRMKTPFPYRRIVSALAIFVLFYLGVMGFWYIRNLEVFGSLFAPGTNRTLWLVNYDQLYNFPASTLTFENWWAAGFLVLAQARWDALLENLQTLLAVQGGLFLLPLVLIGGWRLRKNPVIVVVSTAWIVTFLIMTIVFPLAGSRGGFLHSGAAFQPIFWIAGAEGLAGFVELGVKWRHWKYQRALVGFGILCVVMAGIVTAGLTAVRIAPGTGDGGWTAGRDAYADINSALDKYLVPEDNVIMVNNPPGFYVTTGRPAVAIPNGDAETILAAAKKYQVQYLVLEKNTVKGMVELYLSPADLPGLKYLGSVGQARLFQIQNP